MQTLSYSHLTNQSSPQVMLVHLAADTNPLGMCAKPFDQTREQHDKKRSVLILFGKRLLLRELKSSFTNSLIL
jgi:hypothetical protein